MSLSHQQIWIAIDRLAERQALSPSGLARLAKLDPTTFNPSKRSSNGRLRWPSTESIARILNATGTRFDDFLKFGNEAESLTSIPLAPFAKAQQRGWFDDKGHAIGKGWKSLPFPGLPDPHCFALDLGASFHPAFRKGCCVIVSPLAETRRHDVILFQTADGALDIGRLRRKSLKTLEWEGIDGPKRPGLPLNRLVWIHRIIWASQ